MEQKEWQLIWSDEFDQKEIISANWNRQVEEAGRFNEEWQRYTDSPENAYIENSCLVIEAKHQSNVHGLNQYTSARLNTARKFSFKYGKIAARIKLPFGEGIWPAFWMLGVNIDENGGDTPWPLCGEIDILELYGSKDDGSIEINTHYADAAGAHTMTGPETYKLPQGNFCEEFHDFEMEWSEEEITWYVDGLKIWSQSIDGREFKAFHKEFFILLNIAVGGTYSGRPDNTTVFPQLMYVDWIRVYKSSLDD